jgi:hypothetical protein
VKVGDLLAAGAVYDRANFDRFSEDRADIEGVNEFADCDLICSRGLQLAFGSWKMSK